ncbi:hypothetical protein SAFG77S_04738 [Streptomyces afghaniensis]
MLASLKDPQQGDEFRIWTDQHGRMVALDSATALTMRSSPASAWLAAGGLLEGGRRLIVWRMVRRRYARWDQAWDKAGPDWGRTGTGS